MNENALAREIAALLSLDSDLRERHISTVDDGDTVSVDIDGRSYRVTVSETTREG
jgi:hypothetical protein